MSSKLWTSSTRGRRYWFTNLEQTPATTGTIQTTYSRISPNKRPKITDGSKFDNWSRSPYATWVFNNTKEKWLTNWSSHEPDLWHLTNNNFPMTQMMTSAEVVSQQSFWKTVPSINSIATKLLFLLMYYNLKWQNKQVNKDKQWTSNNATKQESTVEKTRKSDNVWCKSQWSDIVELPSKKLP